MRIRHKSPDPFSLLADVQAPRRFHDECIGNDAAGNVVFQQVQGESK